MDDNGDKKIPSGKTGLPRIIRAFSFSWAGFKYMCGEDAFRQELLLAVVGGAALFFIQTPLPMKLAMFASLILILVVETLNTGMENLVDMVTTEYDERAKRVKDMGSLAVLLSFVVAGLIWGAGLAMMSPSSPADGGATSADSGLTETGK